MRNRRKRVRADEPSLQRVAAYVAKARGRTRNRHVVPQRRLRQERLTRVEEQAGGHHACHEPVAHDDEQRRLEMLALAIRADVLLGDDALLRAPPFPSSRALSQPATRISAAGASSASPRRPLSKPVRHRHVAEVLRYSGSCRQGRVF